MPYLDVRYGKNCHLTKKDMFLIGAKLKTNTNAIFFQINLLLSFYGIDQYGRLYFDGSWNKYKYEELNFIIVFIVKSLGIGWNSWMEEEKWSETQEAQQDSHE